MQLIAGESLKSFYPALRHENGQLRSPSGAWIAMDGFSRGFRDFSGNSLDAIFQGGYAPTLGSSPYGPAWTFDGSASHVAKTPNLTMPASVGAFAAVIRIPPATGANQRLLASTVYGGGAQSLYWQLNAIGVLRAGIGNRTMLVSGIAPGWHVIACRWGLGGPSVYQDVWVDGVQVAVDSTQATYTPPSPDYLTFGGSTVDASVFALDSAFLWSGSLSDSETRLWSADPWGRFRPKPPIPALWTPPHFLSLLGVGS